MKKIGLFSVKNIESEESSHFTFETLTRSGSEPIISTSVKFNTTVNELSITARESPLQARHSSEVKLERAIELQQAVFDKEQNPQQSSRLDAPKGKSQYINGPNSIVYDRACALLYYYDALNYRGGWQRAVASLEEERKEVDIAAAVANKHIADAKSKGVTFPGGEEKVLEKLLLETAVELQMIEFLMNIQSKDQEALSSYGNTFKNIESLVSEHKVIVGYNTIFSWIKYYTALNGTTVFSKRELEILGSRSIFTLRDLVKVFAKKNESEKIKYLGELGITGDRVDSVLEILNMTNKKSNPTLGFIPEIDDDVLKVLTDRCIVTLSDVKAITKNCDEKLSYVKAVKDAIGLSLADSKKLVEDLMDYGLMEKNTVSTRPTQQARNQS